MIGSEKEIPRESKNAAVARAVLASEPRSYTDGRPTIGSGDEETRLFQRDFPAISDAQVDRIMAAWGWQLAPLVDVDVSRQAARSMIAAVLRVLGEDHRAEVERDASERGAWVGSHRRGQKHTFTPDGSDDLCCKCFETLEAGRHK